jgi:hypothetical protein
LSDEHMTGSFDLMLANAKYIGKSKQTSTISITVGGKKSQLKGTTPEKDLIIWCSSDLKHSEHVEKAVSKAN